jgi:predicted oxidoreductase
MIWSPLAGGRLLAGEDEAARRVQAALASAGARLGCSAATAAYAWLLRHPSRPRPVAGSRRIEALAEAVRALSVDMDAETWHEVLAAGQGREVP